MDISPRTEWAAPESCCEPGAQRALHVEKAMEPFPSFSWFPPGSPPLFTPAHPTRELLERNHSRLSRPFPQVREVPIPVSKLHFFAPASAGAQITQITLSPWATWLS